MFGQLFSVSFCMHVGQPILCRYKPAHTHTLCMSRDLQESTHAYQYMHAHTVPYVILYAIWGMGGSGNVHAS